ncbi:MAG: hypothetical protein ACREN4_08880 [Candidatus Dormibacteria bacterium]
MAWPAEAVLILAALWGCWLACVAVQAAWVQRSWVLAVVGAALLGSLFAEVSALNGDAPAGSVGGLGVVAMLLAGVALAGFAAYLLAVPPPEEELAGAPILAGPSSNPDSEA